MTASTSGDTPTLCGTQASAIVSSYLSRSRESGEAHGRAEKVMPGGNSRQAGYWRPYPLTIAEGKGTELRDIDGNRYIDLNVNYTAMVHGHAYGPIEEAVRAQLGKGTGWAAGCLAQTELAELLVGRVASVEQLRFTNSGSEAGNLAMMIARVVTGRQKILMARYGYHGSIMEFEVGSFGSEGPMTYIAAYNDAADFERVLAEKGDQIAAVFLEGVQGPGGVVVGEPDFLHRVRGAAHAAGALFVLDEVLTFRFGVGGVQESLGLDPDLTMFGKIIGGGFPVGAVGGKKEFLGIFDPADIKAYHTGTFNGNPITMTAGAISVRHLTAERIKAMSRHCRALNAGIEEAAKRCGLPITLNHYESVSNIFFAAQAPVSAMARADGEVMDRFHMAALNHGVFIANRGLIALSTAMTDATVAEAVAGLGAAMEDVAVEIV